MAARCDKINIRIKEFFGAGHPPEYFHVNLIKIQKLLAYYYLILEKIFLKNPNKLSEQKSIGKVYQSKYGFNRHVTICMILFPQNTASIWYLVEIKMLLYGYTTAID